MSKWRHLTLKQKVPLKNSFAHLFTKIKQKQNLKATTRNLPMTNDLLTNHCACGTGMQLLDQHKSLT